MKSKNVDNYFGENCDSCNKECTGDFIVFPSGLQICQSCTDKLVIEVKVRELRKELDK